MTAQQFDLLRDVWAADDEECIEDYPVMPPLEKGDYVFVFAMTTDPDKHMPYEQPAPRWTPGIVIDPRHLEWDANNKPIEGVLVRFRDGWTWSDRAGKFVPVCRTANVDPLRVVLFQSQKAADTAEAVPAA